jgi:nitrite reductase (NO-forming)
MIKYFYLSVFILSVLLSGCKPQTPSINSELSSVPTSVQNVQPVSQIASDIENPTVTPESNFPSPREVEFRLRTEIVDRRMVFVGVGGEIDEIVNPDLFVTSGDQVRMVLENGDGIPHDLTLPEFNAKTPIISTKEKSGEMSFTVGEDMLGTYAYFCTLPGHRQAGQEGKLVVSEP